MLRLRLLFMFVGIRDTVLWGDKLSGNSLKITHKLKSVVFSLCTESRFFSPVYLSGNFQADEDKRTPPPRSLKNVQNCVLYKSEAEECEFLNFRFLLV